MNNQEQWQLGTLAVHAGEPTERAAGAVTQPIYQSSTFEYGGEDSQDELKYIRLNNTPNHQALHNKLAALECAEAAVVTVSGMAAVSTTLLTVLRSGDHLLVQDSLYGGTHDLLHHDFVTFGIEYDFVDANSPTEWKDKLRPNTRAFYCESMTNPRLQVGDLEGIVSFCRQHQLTSLIDGTFTTPVNFRPLELGFDLVLHSGTKYLNGHADIVCGAVMGSSAWIEQITAKLNRLGGSLDPHACFLLQRGLKTLALRVARQNQNGQQIAALLDNDPRVQRVDYPGLPSHPQHARASRLFTGFGSTLSFELPDAATAQRFLAAITLPIVAPSLGGVESLITLPGKTTHRGLTPAAKIRTGITDGLVRVSLGIEETEDLLADFEQALAQ